MESKRHTPKCEKREAGVGECPGCAEESVDAIFCALSKSKKNELIGELNEALCFIGKAKVDK